MEPAIEREVAGAVQTVLPRRLALLADAALLVVTLIWGTTFVMVKEAVAAYPVFSFMALRFAIGALALLPLAYRRRPAAGSVRSLWPVFVPPVVVGAFLFAGYAFQTFGLQHTTAAKAGFITGLGVVLVPVLSAAVLKQLPTRGAWAGSGLALAGLALLALQADLSIGFGDLLVLFCAIAFAVQILMVAHYAPRLDTLWLALGQIATVALFSGLAALLFETPRPALDPQVIFAIVFTGLLATAAAFWMQSVAQRFATPTHTALIFTAEPVFAAVTSYLLLSELLSPQQLLGCALILAGMLAGEFAGSRKPAGGAG